MTIQSTTKESRGKALAIRQSIWIETEPNQVYRSLTNPEGLERWLVKAAKAKDEVTTTLSWDGVSFDIEYIDCEPDTKVTMLWGCGNGAGDKVTFELESQEDGTMVTLTHSGFSETGERLQSVIDHVEGWAVYLCNLKVYLEKDWDLRQNQPPGTIIS